MLATIQRWLDYKVSVATLVQSWLWLSIPYLLIGFGWTVFHPEYASHMQTHLFGGLPAGAEVAAMLESALLWPILLFGSGICPT